MPTITKVRVAKRFADSEGFAFAFMRGCRHNENIFYGDMGVKDRAEVRKPSVPQKAVESMMRVMIAIVVVGITFIVGGLVILAQAPLSPVVQKVEHVVPDDRIPR
jgi:hypothetical protein